jgi:Tfp pilus assembly protein PilN
MERILLHVVQAITVVGIVGGYVSLSELKTSNAVLQTQVESLTERMDDLRSFAGDKYTARQAARDIAPLLEKVSDHEARIRKLEAIRREIR